MIKYKNMNIFSKKIDINKQELYKSEIVKNFDVIINPKQYAFWEIKNKDFVATFYNSGKFVIQGKNPDILTEMLKLKKNEDTKNCDEKNIKIHIPFPHIGTDESGKGDFFGPLVIAGVLANDKN